MGENINSVDQKPSIIFANEFFDCFSIKQYIKVNNRWNEKKINFNKKENRFYIKNILIDDIPLNIKLDKYAAKNENTEQQLIEISPSTDKYIDKIGNCFSLGYSVQ